MFTAVGTYYSFQKIVCCPVWIGTCSNPSCVTSWFFFTQFFMSVSISHSTRRSVICIGKGCPTATSPDPYQCGFSPNSNTHDLISKPFFQHTHIGHHRASDPTCYMRLFLSELSPQQDKFVNDFFSVTYFVTAVVLSFLGTLYGDTGWIGVAYNRLATNEPAVTLAVAGSSFGSVPLPHQTREIRFRWRKPNFAYQNRRRKLSGTRNGSNATELSTV